MKYVCNLCGWVYDEEIADILHDSVLLSSEWFLTAISGTGFT